MNYLMKISRARVVTIGGKTGQLKSILRIKRNSRTKSKSDFINGIKCHFYVVIINALSSALVNSPHKISISLFTTFPQTKFIFLYLKIIQGVTISRF